VASTCRVGARCGDPRPIVPLGMIDGPLSPKLPTAKVGLARPNNGERATIPISSHPLDLHTRRHRRTERVRDYRRSRLDADRTRLRRWPAATVAGIFGRIDSEQADALGPGADRVAIDHANGA
jgi:hypothetical protein